MDAQLSRNTQRQVLLTALTLVLAALAGQPWWTAAPFGGKDITITGWGIAFSLDDWQAAGGGSDAFSVFVGMYVLLAIAALAAGVFVPYDAMPRWGAIVLGAVAGCLGCGLALMDLVNAGADRPAEMFAAFRVAWIGALGVSVLWFRVSAHHPRHASTPGG